MAKDERRAGRAWKLVIVALSAAFVAAGAWYGYWTWRYRTGTPTLSRNFRMEWNEPILATPESDRAWPEYRHAYIMMAPEVRDRERWRGAPKPGDGAWATWCAELESVQAELELIRSASRRRVLGRLYTHQNDSALEMHTRDLAEIDASLPMPESEDTNGMAAGVILDHAAALRKLCGVLSADAACSAERGDGARALQDIETILRIGRHLWAEPMLIQQLMAVSMMSSGLSAAGDILSARPEVFSDEQLVALSKACAAIPGERDRLSIACDRDIFLDLVQRIYTDNGRGGGRLCAEGVERVHASILLEPPPALLGPLYAALGATRAELVAEHGRVMDAVEAEGAKPLWERRSADEYIEAYRGSGSLLGFDLIGFMAPATSRAFTSAEVAWLRRDAILVGVALERYRRSHGSYPASLEALVPEFIEGVPVDRFDGRPLRYVLTDEGPLVYSAGADRDDDGGRLHVDPNTGRIEPFGAADWKADPARARDGDLVLWPQPDAGDP
jgi:hypothetical protein